MDSTRAAPGPVMVGEGVPIGTKAGAYVIENQISEGGCGTVYRARHELLGRPAAVKVLHKEMVASTMAKRFFLEALAVNMIRHPAIVDVFEFGELADGRPFYVMEYLEGVDLDTQIKRSGRMAPREAIALLDPVCQALEAAHRTGFVHRDVKASNVHVSHSLDGRMIVELLDFGVAKALDAGVPGAGLTTAGARIGTSSTMAPEQILGGDITPRTDIYSLGVLAFRMLVGRNPFVTDDPRELDQMHLKAKAPRASAFVAVPTAVDAVIAKAMAKDPAERYPTAGAFFEAFKNAMEGAGQARTSARAVGLYVEIATAEDADELDLYDQMACADLAEQAMEEAGMTLAMQAGNILLGVRVLPANQPDEDARVRNEVIATGRQMFETLAARPDPRPGTRVKVVVHAGDADVRNEGDVALVEGGEILNLGAWVPAEFAGDLIVTEAAGAALN